MSDPNKLYMRRTYLEVQAMEAIPNAHIFMVQEAVASVALAHPEWNMNEMRTWDEWEQEVAHER